MRKLKKRILIALGITVTLLLILYFGRRLFFESLIIGEAEQTLATLLGVEAKIGAVRGDWLSNVIVENVTLTRKAAAGGAAYQIIEDVDIELDYSVFSLIGGDLAGLERLSVHAKTIALDTGGSWSQPTNDSPKPTEEPTSLADLLRMFRAGAKIEVDNLILEPEYLARGAATITLEPGTSTRKIKITVGSTTVTGSIDSQGEYDATVKGQDGGRLLRALGIQAVEDAGNFELIAQGNLERSTLKSTLDFKTKLTSGQEVIADYEIRVEQGQLTAPKLRFDLPGIEIRGSGISIPIDDLTNRRRSSLNGALSVKIEDLSPYKAKLPEQLLAYLPITGDVQVEVRRGVLHLQPSMLSMKGARLDIQRGSLSLVDETGGDLALRQFRRAKATGLGIGLTIANPLTIALPGADPVVLAGTILASASGRLDELEAQADLDLRDVRYTQFAVARLAGRVRFDGAKITLEKALAKGVKRTLDDFATDVAGGGTFWLPTANEPARFDAALLAKVPGAALALANLPKEFAKRLELSSELQIEAGGSLPKGVALPPGNVRIRWPGIVFRDVDQFDLDCKATLDADRLQIENLVFTGTSTSLTARGTVDLGRKEIDVSAELDAKKLGPILRALDQPDLEGELKFGQLMANGPWSRPRVAVDGTVKLSSISPKWFGDRAAAQMPQAPLELTLKAKSVDESFDIDSLELSWGLPDRRVTLTGRGPVPLKLTEGGLAAAPRQGPLVLNLGASFEPKPFMSSTGTVAIDSRIECDATAIRVPKFTARSTDGTIQALAIDVGAGLADLVNGTVKWSGVTLSGSLGVEKFDIGTLAAQLLPVSTAGVRPEVRGELNGNLKVSGRIGEPEVEGSITLGQASVLYADLPKLEVVRAKATLARNSIALEFTPSGTTEQRKLLEASTGTAPLWRFLAPEGAPIEAKLNSMVLDLAYLRRLVKQAPDLHGKVTIDGSLDGTLQKLSPALIVKVREVGWKIPDTGQKIEGLTADVRITRDTLRLENLGGEVPALNKKLSAKGEFQVLQGAALWEFAKEAGPTCRASFEFSGIPLGLLPRTSDLDAAKGTAGGTLGLTGTWSNPRPSFLGDIVDAELKLKSLPRIDNLEVHVDAKPEKATVTGSATMGAGPLKIVVEFTPGNKENVFEAYEAGSIGATVKGERVLLTRTGGLKVRGDLDLEAKGNFKRIDLTGTIELHDSKFIKRLSLVPDLKVTSGASAGDTFGPWAIEGGERLVFDVAVKTKKPFVVQTNVIDTDLDVSCRLRGQGNALTLAGACTSRSGTIRFPGMSMRISAMRLMFRGNAIPEILVIASGQRHGVRVNMRLDGSVDDAVPKLSSSPALQPRDLWTLVTTGARPEALAANSATSNTAILATYVIQELVLTYFASESTEASQSFVSRFTFEFGRELSRDGAETWEVNFDIGDLWVMPPRFGLRFERDVYEDFNLGLVYRWRF